MGFPLITSAPGAPDWARQLVNQINSAFQGVLLPKSPLRFPSFIAGSGANDPKRTLPAASDWPSLYVDVADIQRLARSNGTNWIRQDTGASI